MAWKFGGTCTTGKSIAELGRPQPASQTPHPPTAGRPAQIPTEQAAHSQRPPHVERPDTNPLDSVAAPDGFRKGLDSLVELGVEIEAHLRKVRQGILEAEERFTSRCAHLG